MSKKEYYVIHSDKFCPNIPDEIFWTQKEAIQAAKDYLEETEAESLDTVLVATVYKLHPIAEVTLVTKPTFEVEDLT
ncbi:MAG: hypothetical protein ACXAD7_28150 [Candidatus Kariarchaeaceae archaeon]|jgi:hypothetical protein